MDNETRIIEYEGKNFEDVQKQVRASSAKRLREKRRELSQRKSLAEN